MPVFGNFCERIPELSVGPPEVVEPDGVVAPLLLGERFVLGPSDGSFAVPGLGRTSEGSLALSEGRPLLSDSVAIFWGSLQAKADLLEDGSVISTSSEGSPSHEGASAISPKRTGCGFAAVMSRGVSVEALEEAEVLRLDFSRVMMLSTNLSCSRHSFALGKEGEGERGGERGGRGERWGRGGGEGGGRGRGEGGEKEMQHL